MVLNGTIFYFAMKIHIGTENPSKIGALTEVLREYPLFADSEVVGYAVPSGVVDQPLTLDETMLGAENRAKACYTADCHFSVGIESGFLEAPRARGGLMEVTICAIYDGHNFHHGFSSSFNCPEKIMKYIREGKDLNDAAYLAGYTTNQEIGKTGDGVISILTRGRVTRKEYTMQALRMALIHVEDQKD